MIKAKLSDIIGSVDNCTIRGFVPLQKKSDIKNNESLKIKKYKDSLLGIDELSENEEIKVYYESYEVKKKYDTLRLFYKFYFFEAYEALNSGIDFMHFIHTEKKKPLALTGYYNLLNQLVNLFTEKYGEPEKRETDKEPFKKTTYTWLFKLNDISTTLIINDSMDETEKYNQSDYAQILNIIVGVE